MRVPDRPAVTAGELPWLEFHQMAEADRLAVEDFGIGLLQMMEHAGSALAEITAEAAPQGHVVVLAGGGNNGGGGLTAARHLANRGLRVSVVLAAADPGASVRHHLRTLKAMGIAPEADPPDDAVVVDALVGYGLQGPLRGRARELALWSQGRPVISLDVPSGHGHPGAVRPDITVTLALPKVGLEDLENLYLADLGLPPQLWRRLDIDVGDAFASGGIVRVLPGNDREH